MDQIEEVVPMLAGLRSFGIRIAIDDFGTGYSSLSHLKRLPIDYLKLDRSFTRDVGGADGRSIASAIVGLGHALGLTALAEGVENGDEAAALRARGYEELQGFHFAGPLPLDRNTGAQGEGAYCRVDRSCRRIIKQKTTSDT